MGTRGGRVLTEGSRAMRSGGGCGLVDGWWQTTGKSREGWGQKQC